MIGNWLLTFTSFTLLHTESFRGESHSVFTVASISRSSGGSILIAVNKSSNCSSWSTSSTICKFPDGELVSSVGSDFGETPFGVFLPYYISKDLKRLSNDLHRHDYLSYLLISYLSFVGSRSSSLTSSM